MVYPIASIIFRRFNVSRIICVAGNLGSGKTTLVHSLARELGWQIRPTVGYDTSYIEDLFRNPNRWSFEAQMAFLSHKARSIKEAVRKGIDFVVDRSIYEDIDIFAQIFANLGTMDSRAFSTYTSYANLLVEDLVVPLAIIYCMCPPRICENRLANRPRPYQSLFPKGHIERLHKQYEVWTSNFNLCPLFALDTSTYDTRNVDVIKHIARDLSVLLSSGTSKKATQLELFPTAFNDVLNEKQPQLLRPLNNVQVEHTSKFHITQAKPLISLPSRRPSVYIAAPFSAVTTSTTSSDSSDGAQKLKLLDVPRQHGIIPLGQYRKALSDISKAFEKLGYQAILPHRDVNKWGKKELSPKEVGQECLRLVRECDLFFGMLGASFGAHVETGMALALSKPTILVSVEADQETFMGRALRESGFSVSIKVQNLEELISLVNSPSFQEILEHAGAIIRRRLL